MSEEKMNQKVEKAYDGSSIQILEGLAAVRKRPGMYIGDTGDRGFHHLVWEILDNSVDEAMAGFCDSIEIEILAPNKISIADNGRGMPVDMHPVKGIPACEVILTVLHAGGKFDSGAYKVSGGLHGVGASVVNALSERLDLTVWRDGREYRQAYEKGVPVSPLTTHKKKERVPNTGTKITFSPDSCIFLESNNEFDKETIKKRIREIAWLVPGISISLIDSSTEEKFKENQLKKQETVFGKYGEIFHETDGLESMVNHMGRNVTPLFKGVVCFSGESQNTSVDIAFKYNDDYSERIYSYVNLIPTKEGGTHVSGFRTALTRAVNESARYAKILKEKDDNISGDDLKEGLLSVVSVKTANPQFEGQTKTKLGNGDVAGIVSSIVYDRLTLFFANEGAGILKTIVEKAVTTRKAREAARKAREIVRKGASTVKFDLPGKLADCISKNPAENELYIVEGDSAGGSAKQGRDRKFQAILPLRGKILNCEKSSLSKTLENAEITTIIKALGCGLGDDFDILKLRYDKIIIMTDADVDGSHIRTLLLALFHNLFPELVELGKIYAGQPPLYRLRFGKDKSEKWLYSESELKKETKNLKQGSYSIQRYKGLGEMSAEQLWETTMNPEKRMLKRIIPTDNPLDMEESLDLVMGKNVKARREFVFETALSIAEKEEKRSA